MSTLDGPQAYPGNGAPITTSADPSLGKGWGEEHRGTRWHPPGGQRRVWKSHIRSSLAAMEHGWRYLYYGPIMLVEGRREDVGKGLGCVFGHPVIMDDDGNTETVAIPVSAAGRDPVRGWQRWAIREPLTAQQMADHHLVQDVGQEPPALGWVDGEGRPI